MVKTYIGVDNGVTGSLAMIRAEESAMVEVPVVRQQSYQKEKAQITRIAYHDLVACLSEWVRHSRGYAFVVIERPYVNPKGFKATASALRALEATLIAVESLGLPYAYVDSRQWQRQLLPKGVRGTSELKLASRDIGIRLFPQLSDAVTRHGDADSLLIAEWARREGL